MIAKLVLQDFRNIETLNSEFHPSLNIILGDNGSGKSSILEGVFYLAHGKSFRTSNSDILVQLDKKHFSVSAKTLLGNQLGLRKGCGVNSRFNEIKIDGDRCYKFSELAKKFAVQIITPESFYLFFGGPKQRRRFLDLGLFHVEHRFTDTWKYFSRTLKQRNACLKLNTSSQDLHYWTDTFIKASENISTLRKAYAIKLTTELNFWINILLPQIKDSITVKYDQGWSSNLSLADALSRVSVKELKLGYSLVGAHKFDIKFLVDNKPIETQLSRGQQKLFLIALTLAQTKLIEQQKQLIPVLLIDDVGAELDEHSRALLNTAINALECQIILTAIETDSVAQFITDEKNYYMFHVKHGTLSKVNEQAKNYDNRK